MRAVPQQYEASGYKRGMKRLIRGWAIPILVSIRSYTFYVFADFLPDGRSIRVGSTAGGCHSPNYPPRPTLRLPVGNDGLCDGARWRHGLLIVTVFVCACVTGSSLFRFASCLGSMVLPFVFVHSTAYVSSSRLCGRRGGVGTGFTSLQVLPYWDEERSWPWFAPPWHAQRAAPAG